MSSISQMFSVLELPLEATGETRLVTLFPDREVAR
jgi:hypothetical protein